jgi:tetratricopeptide (TPR) repeat protein
MSPSCGIKLRRQAVPPSVQRVSDVATDSDNRPLSRRVLDHVFGYDFFISYTWSDGFAYAKTLGDRLESEGFAIFLDRTEYASGDDWKKVGAWTLRRTGQLILVGSPGVLRSAPVLREVEIFSKTRRRIIPIDFAGSLDWNEAGCPLAQYLPSEILRVKESAAALESGPSEGTISTLRRTFNLVRQDKKRTRVFAAIAFVLLLLSIASMGFAAFAEWQREKAERRFDIAINIASGVVDKAVALSDRYHVPKSATGELLDWADLSFGALSKEDLPDRLKAAQANVLIALSDYYAKVGDAEKQLHVAEQSRDVLLPLAYANPRNDEWRARLSMAYDRIGQADLARGKLAEALGAHREQLKQDERLLADRPSDPGRQRRISVSQERIGTILALQGKVDDAVTAQKIALSIATRLAAERPDDVESQRDLAVSHEKLGELLKFLGKGQEALANHQEALHIRFDLAQRRHPENTGLQRELAISYNKVGAILLANGELSDALEAHRASLEIAKKLTQSDPTNAEWQNDLAGTQLLLGEVLYEQKKNAEALAAYKESLALGERLVAANPGQAIFRFGVASSHERIGDIQLELGQLDEALASYESKLDIAAALFADDPANGEFQRDLLIANVKVGDALRAKGADARANYLAALNIAENMAASGRLNPQDAWMVSDLRKRVGR